MSINEKRVLVLRMRNTVSDTSYVINLNSEDFSAYEEYKDMLEFFIPKTLR